MGRIRTRHFILWISVIVGLMMLASVAMSAEDAWKNPISPQLAAEGWIALFDGKTTYGLQARGDCKWTVADGALVCGEGTRGRLRTTTEFSGFVLRLQYRLPADAKAAILHGVQRRGSGRPVSAGSTEIVGKEGGQWQDVEIKGEGARGFITIQGTPKLEIRNVLLKPANIKSIFNGKDLRGWKPLVGPNWPSKFSVVDGCLNIVNGGGDIQTEEQWKDFCCQLDIKSNNENPKKPLNSGVFFRAEPGKFWWGYEAQIRNEFSDGDRTKPVDFGTGAIYSRQPARRVVPSENEWYTMTIVAAGNHISTWVNGYQATDYTDTNPPGAPREGKCKIEAGAISLQGHDPTTNMLFKNIKVATYPELKQE